MTPANRSRRALLLLPVGVAALALLGTACSGGTTPRVASLGSSTSTTAAGAQAGTPSPGALVADLDRYATCMRAHGVPDFPDPVISQSANGETVQAVKVPATGQSPAFKAAANACKSLRPPAPTPPPITPAQQQAYLSAAACMRSHGISGFPDPVFSGGDVRFPIPAGMDPNSPQFLQARQTCQKLIPAGLPYSS